MDVGVRSPRWRWCHRARRHVVTSSSVGGEDRLTDPVFERINTFLQADGVRRADTCLFDCRLELDALPLNALHVLIHCLPGVGV